MIGISKYNVSILLEDVSTYCPSPSMAIQLEMTFLAMLLAFLCLALHMHAVMHVVELAQFLSI